VRLAVSIALILLACTSSLRSQEQVTDMRMKKILNPDKNASSNLQGKTFYGGKSFQPTTPAYVKGFYYPSIYDNTRKGFLTRSFYSPTNLFLSANPKFGTMSAYAKGRYDIPNASKSVETKPEAIKAAGEMDKGFALHDSYRTDRYLGQGKSQKILDQQQAKSSAMSIDQVRELLNKNK